MPRLGSPRAMAPLRHRGYRLLVAGQVTSNAGDACYAVALPWYVLSEGAAARRCSASCSPPTASRAPR